MLSLDLAKQLKELLGTKKYMKIFPCPCQDCCGGKENPPCWDENDGYLSCESYKCGMGNALPTLSQLLDEVEKRGYKWTLSYGWLRGKDTYYLHYFIPGIPTDWRDTWREDLVGYTPEDAVALALIEIVKGERDGD